MEKNFVDPDVISLVSFGSKMILISGRGGGLLCPAPLVVSCFSTSANKVGYVFV